jgi:hypothetical protein
MSSYQFEQSIAIRASATAVEQCITDQKLMHRWLNPALRCEPIGKWSTAVGSKGRFVIQVPLMRPTLNTIVIEREPGWWFGDLMGSSRAAIAGNVSRVKTVPI